MTVKQISIFLENKPGKLAEVTKVISDNNINIIAMSLAEAEDFGIVRLIVKDLYNATNVLKNAGFILSIKDLIAIEISDKPGSFSLVLELLGKNDVNLEYMYAFTAHTSGCVNMVLKVADNKKATAILSENNVKMISQDYLA